MQCKLVYNYEEMQSTVGDKENEVELIQIEDEEERDKQSVELALKKYSKPLRFLFSKYCFSTGAHNKNTLFNEIESEYQTCTLADIWKMCREYELSDSVTKEQVQSIVKKINLKVSNKAEINNLDYEGFKTFIITVAHIRCMKKKSINNNYMIG